MRTIEEVLRNRVKVVGDGEWTLLGTPAEAIKELEQVKLAHADVVIGGDREMCEKQHAHRKEWCSYCDEVEGENSFRAEQRERNK